MEDPLQHHRDEGAHYHIGVRNKGLRLDEYLHERIPRLSHDQVLELIRTRVTTSWEKQPRPETLVEVGGELRIHLPKLDEEECNPDIEIVEQDSQFLAVNKPGGLLMHPTSWARKNTLTRILERRHQQRFLMVHRLDRDTSGLVVLARTKGAARFLQRAFHDRRVEKEYLALVEGRPEQEEGRIELPISAPYFTSRGMKRGVAQSPLSGDRALTGYRVERVGTRRTLLRVFPRTGRTHQIRIHLQALGCPVVGDKLYGQESLEGLGLHSWRLAFEHPASDKRVELEAPPPAWFALGS